MKKSSIIITAFVLGVLLTVFTYQAITVFQYRTQAASDHATLTQVVDFLNQNIQQAQQKSSLSNQQVQASAPVSNPTPTKKQAPVNNQ